MISETVKTLDRKSVEAAVADYLLQINYCGYQPDTRKVLSVRSTDRTAWLRDAATRARWEVYYFIEGELFPHEGDTRLPEGLSHTEHAAHLVDKIWDDLWVWNGYDFTTTSYGLNRQNYLQNDADNDGGIFGGTHAPV
ncbi:MAG: hypothetical protein LBQ51_00460 [Desulfovibrio sp.]|nr:hypothetical protein [Desulfovibrio sp.]